MWVDYHEAVRTHDAHQSFAAKDLPNQNDSFLSQHIIGTGFQTSARIPNYPVTEAGNPAMAQCLWTVGRKWNTTWHPTYQGAGGSLPTWSGTCPTPSQQTSTTAFVSTPLQSLSVSVATNAPNYLSVLGNVGAVLFCAKSMCDAYPLYTLPEAPNPSANVRVRIKKLEVAQNEEVTQTYPDAVTEWFYTTKNRHNGDSTGWGIRGYSFLNGPSRDRRNLILNSAGPESLRMSSAPLPGGPTFTEISPEVVATAMVNEEAWTVPGLVFHGMMKEQRQTNIPRTPTYKWPEGFSNWSAQRRGTLQFRVTFVAQYEMPDPPPGGVEVGGWSVGARPKFRRASPYTR